jgi:hypothetical protein
LVSILQVFFFLTTCTTASFKVLIKQATVYFSHLLVVGWKQWRGPSSMTGHYIAWWKFTDISAAQLTLWPWRWRQFVHLKHGKLEPDYTLPHAERYYSSHSNCYENLRCHNVKIVSQMCVCS